MIHFQVRVYRVESQIALDVERRGRRTKGEYGMALKHARRAVTHGWFAS